MIQYVHNAESIQKRGMKKTIRMEIMHNIYELLNALKEIEDEEQFLTNAEMARLTKIRGSK